MSAIAYCFPTGTESEDSIIALGLRRHDAALLNLLVEQHQRRLLHYLVYLSGNRELAQDLFQETWIRVLERGHQFNGRIKFSTWLYAIARNLTMDHFRKKSPLSLDGLLDKERHAPLEPIDPRPSAWEQVALHQQTEQINAALFRIPSHYREAVVLRVQNEFSLEEICAVTGAPLGTVKSRLHRGLNLLLEQLQEKKA